VILFIFTNQIKLNRPNINEKEFFAKNSKKITQFVRENNNLNSETGKLMYTIQSTYLCTFTGEICGASDHGSMEAFSKSVIGKMSSLISLSFINPPASSSYWAYISLEGAGIVPKSYAEEGLGFAMIKPLINLWKIFRDIAYLILVLILVSIGFMIMFRMKINPQTVISVENALPKIVVTLLLITFSFPIAGFLIDVMNLLILLIVSILSGNNSYYNTNEMQNMFFQSNLITLWELINPIPKNIQNITGPARFAYLGDAVLAVLPEQINYALHAIGSSIAIVFGTIAAVQIGDQAGITSKLDGIGTSPGGVMGKIFKGVFGIVLILMVVGLMILLLIHGFGLIVGFFISLGVLGMVFTIFFILLRSYIQITLSIVLSPIILLFEALPGKSVFSFWFKGLIGELITFPTVITLLLVQKVLFMTMMYPGDFWNAPFLGRLSPGSFAVIFGLGIVMVTPDIIKLVKEAIGAKPLPIDIGLNAFFGQSGTVAGGAVGLLGQFSSIKLGLNAMGIGGGEGFLGLKSKPARKTTDKIDENDKTDNLDKGGT